MFEKLKQLLKKKEPGKGTPPSSGKTPLEVTDPVPSVPADPTASPVERPGKMAPLPPQKVKKARPKKGKHGISVLSSAEDLEALFNDEGAHDVPPPPMSKPEPKAQMPPVPPRPAKKPVKRNRHGILMLEDEKDLFALMAEEAHREGDRVVFSASKTVAKQKAPSVKKVQKDRHGLPILEQGQMPASGEAGSFAALLESSLSEKSEEVLLYEKVDKVEQGRALTLKERLKRYPASQGQLDLHGYTAAKADQTAEHYVRRAFSVGTYTLRLIVGKGLHSEHGAVLPDTIADRMTALKQEGVVLAWEWEKGKKSKSGSILVYLNNYDSSRHRR